jgi:dTDP-4-dehydrorhamnose reductase
MLQILDNFIKCNSILPWYLDGICSRHQIKLINFSTDCVFRGTVGNYNEESIPDASDIYGVTKRLGEVHSATTLNLRTSFFGVEVANAVGLIEWFLSQKGVVKGFSGAIYSGIYNKLFAINVLDLIICNPTMYGLWHIASIPTSKFEILSAIKEKLNLKDIEVIEDSEFKCDRSLNCEKIVKEIGYKKFTWDFMLDLLCDEILIRKQLCSKTKK